MYSPFYVFEGIYENYKWDYLFWRILTIFISPIVLLMLLLWALGNLMILIIAYTSALFTYFYERFSKVRDDGNSVNNLRRKLSWIWIYTANIWHGYEVIGMENFPKRAKGGALLVMYHGAIPLDAIYFLAHCFISNHTDAHLYIANFMFRFPGLQRIMAIGNIFTGGYSEILQRLNQGKIVLLLPGGIREGQFGGNNYELLWSKRTGFARLALEAKVPVIPVFTQNIREAFKTIDSCKNWFIKIYDKTKLPLNVVYGGFPVKLRTFIGEPIPYDAQLTPEQAAGKAAKALESLIATHQRVPGSILKALFARLLPDRDAESFLRNKIKIN